MIYFYLVRVRFIKGNSIISKDYRVSFLEIGELFCYLEKKHKHNYELYFIKKLK